MQDYWFLLLSIIPHELGHIVGFLFFNKKFPDIRLNWWGVEVGRNAMLDLKLNHLLITTELGILFGLLFLKAFVVNYNYVLIYLVICAIDINLIIELFSVGKEDKNIVLRDFQLKQAQDIILREKGRSKIQ